MSRNDPAVGNGKIRPVSALYVDGTPLYQLCFCQIGDELVQMDSPFLIVGKSRDRNAVAPTKCTASPSNIPVGLLVLSYFETFVTTVSAFFFTIFHCFSLNKEMIYLFSVLYFYYIIRNVN